MWSGELGHAPWKDRQLRQMRVKRALGSRRKLSWRGSRSLSLLPIHGSRMLYHVYVVCLTAAQFGSRDFRDFLNRSQWDSFG
jgi:hypothetical protein